MKTGVSQSSPQTRARASHAAFAASSIVSKMP